MTDVFISYSRLDKEFVEQLREALLAQKQEIWIDWESIPASQTWWNEIKKGIAKANNFIVVLSPHSMASPICQMEVEYARQLKKRIIAVLLADYEREAALIEISKRLAKPEESTVREIWGHRQPYDLYDANDAELKQINYFFFRSEDEFQKRFEDLLKVINTDYAYKEQHTTLQLRALEWARRGHDVSFLLLDTELAQALTWLSQAKDKEPVPTDLQREYIHASEKRTRQLRNIRRISVLGSIMAVVSLIFAVGASFVGVRISKLANEASTREAAANTQIADANRNLTAVPPTMNAIATQIAEGEGHIESLRLAAEAVDVLNEGGNAETAALLAIRALDTAYSMQADAALLRALVETAAQGFKAHGGGVTSAVFSPDGQYILTGGCDEPGEGPGCLQGSARLWDVASGEIVQEFSTQSGGVTGVAFSPDGQSILTGGCDEPGEGQTCSQGSARLWDVASGEIVQEFSSQSGGVTGVAFSPDGQSILTGGCEEVDDDRRCQRGVARLWEVASGDLIHAFNGHIGTVTSVAFNEDGSYVLTSGVNDPTVQLWDSQTGDLINSYYNGRSGTLTAIFSPDGQKAIISTQYGGLQLWDFEPDDSETDSFEISTTGVSALAFSPGGRYLLTGSELGLVHIWEVQTGRQLRTINSHTHAVLSVSFSPDGRYVMTGSQDGTVRLWDINFDQEARKYSVQYGSVLSVAFDPLTQYVIAGTGRPSVAAWLWDIASGELLQEFTYRNAEVTNVAFSPNNDLVLTGGRDTAKLWDITTGGVVHQFRDQTSTVESMAFSSDGQSILLGGCAEVNTNKRCQRGTARLLNVSSGDLIHLFDGHTGAVTSVAFNPNSDLVLTGGGDTANLWDTNTGGMVHQFRDQNTTVKIVAFSPDGRNILTGECPAEGSCTQGTARLWDAETYQELREFSLDVTRLAFSRDGQYILTRHQLLDPRTGEVNQSFGGSLAISPDGQYVLTDSFPAELLSVETGELVGSFRGHTSGLLDADFSLDGRYVVTSSLDNTARVWSMTTGETVYILAGHIDAVISSAFDPKGKYVLTGSSDSTAKMWDTTTGNVLLQFVGHTGDVTNVAFSPDGRYVVTASNDHTTRLWDIQTGKEYRQFEDSVSSMALSPDGRYLLTGSTRSVKQWEIESGIEETILTVDSGRIMRVAYSLDGSDIQVLTIDDDNFTLWKIGDQTQQLTFIGRKDGVTSAIFSPDVRYVLTGYSDGTVQLRDAVSGEILRSFVGHTGAVSSVAFSQDGRLILTGSKDSTIRLWDSDYHDFINYACTRVWRDFLEDELRQYEIPPDQPTCK